MRLVPFLVLVLVACGGGTKGSGAPSGTDSVQADLEKIRTAADQWKAVKMGAVSCPTIPDLKKEKILAADAKEQDPWGHPYSILCTPTDYKVRSAGPDGILGNEDDISTVTK
ncbi:MAG: type II secretion system protein GspG [Myxococcales bacterium]|nr:type II secretion system protein GspG [Myxococcales bacterium]